MLWRNSGAATAQAGLPRARSAELPAAGGIRAELLFELASQFTQDTEQGEDAILDVETTTVVLALEHGLSEDWSLGLEIPWVRHGGGVLDGVIDDYHDLFGFSDGGRSRAPQDRVFLAWQDDGRLRFGLFEQRSGIGDVRIHLARSLLAETDRRLTLRAGLELPTGSADDLIGSDSLDTHVGLHLTDRRLLATWGWTLHLSAGLLFQGDDEITGDAREPLAGWANWTLAWPLTERWTLKGQLDTHTATADSALRQIGGWSVQGGLGLAYRLRRDFVLEGGFIEDLRPGSAPDVAFQVALRATL